MHHKNNTTICIKLLFKPDITSQLTILSIFEILSISMPERR
jgi:hypothetical protein